MGNSLFHKQSPEEKKPPTPYDLIEKEVEHLKKGSSVRHGGASKNRSVPWLVIIGFVGLAWLYLMDPFYHAWYKGEAVRAYLYLHQYGSEADVAALVGTHILSLEEIDVLNHKNGTFQDYYKSADDARPSGSMSSLNTKTTSSLCTRTNLRRSIPSGACAAPYSSGLEFSSRSTGPFSIRRLLPSLLASGLLHNCNISSTPPLLVFHGSRKFGTRNAYLIHKIEP